MEATIDYETRSQVDLKKAGAIVYAQHPSTSIICLSYKCDDGPTLLWIPERGPMPRDLWMVFKEGTLVAHIASFERAITKHTLPRYDTLTTEQKECLYDLPISRWRWMTEYRRTP